MLVQVDILTRVLLSIVHVLYIYYRNNEIEDIAVPDYYLSKGASVSQNLDDGYEQCTGRPAIGYGVRC